MCLLFLFSTRINNNSYTNFVKTFFLLKVDLRSKSYFGYACALAQAFHCSLRSKSYFWLCMRFSSGVPILFYEVNRTFGYACALAQAFHYSLRSKSYFWLCMRFSSCVLLILLIILIKVQKQAPKTLSSFDA